MDLREEIQLFLREKLNNFFIRIDGKIKTSKNEAQKAYTSHEKFELMAKMNPALLRLKELLQLETGH